MINTNILLEKTKGRTEKSQKMKLKEDFTKRGQQKHKLKGSMSEKTIGRNQNMKLKEAQSSDVEVEIHEEKN